MKSKSWTTVRRHVLLRDGYQCQICGDIALLSYDGALYVHHVVYRSQGGPDDPANAITLCDLCHGVIHGYKEWYGFSKFPLSAKQKLIEGLLWAREHYEWFCRLPLEKRAQVQEEVLQQFGILASDFAVGPAMSNSPFEDGLD